MHMEPLYISQISFWGQPGLVGGAYNPALRIEAGWTGVDTRLWFTVRSSQADRSEGYLGSGSELASNHWAESVLSHAFRLSPESQRDTEPAMKDQKRRKWWGLNQTLACVRFAIFHYTDRLDRKSFELPSEFFHFTQTYQVSSGWNEFETEVLGERNSDPFSILNEVTEVWVSEYRTGTNSTQGLKELNS